MASVNNHLSNTMKQGHVLEISQISDAELTVRQSPQMSLLSAHSNQSCRTWQCNMV